MILFLTNNTNEQENNDYLSCNLKRIILIGNEMERPHGSEGMFVYSGPFIL